MGRFILFFLVSIFLVFPSVVSATHGGVHIVPECPEPSGTPGEQDYNPGGCGWPELVELSVNLMNFLIAISIPLSAIAFAWAGFLYITAAGSEERIKKAHGIFWKVGIGLVLVLAAWLIVWLIGQLLSEPYSVFPS